jgi:hypothetical protein
MHRLTWVDLALLKINQREREGAQDSEQPHHCHTSQPYIYSCINTYIQKCMHIEMCHIHL